jgi:phosphoribosyl 1,2-cyclic phosphate phosphodiesterase
MQLTFLGTAAANAYPEPFCRCPRCEKARALGGASLRKRSAALVNDDLLIDFGPDVLAAAAQHGRPFIHVRYCLQTHAHADHLDPSHFYSRSPGFGVEGAPRLHFYASPASLARAAWLLQHDTAPRSLLDPEVAAGLNLELHPVTPLEPFAVGRYQVVAVPANHDPAVEPLLYAVSRAGRTLFYGTDTAVLPEAAWQAFHQNRLCFDLVVLDHTYGPAAARPDHMNAADFLSQVARMRAEGLLAPAARIFATHLAHDTNPVHPELVELAAPHGYAIAYDGLTVSLD